VWTQHEGDWEAIPIVLNPAMTPRWVGYAQHCLGLRRSWANTARIGRHPVAYIALGSHAAWFPSGLQRIPREADCLTPAENAQLDSGHVTVYDRTSKGSVSGPPGLTGLGTTRRKSVTLVSRSPPGWMSRVRRRIFACSPMSSRRRAWNRFRRKLQTARGR